MSEPTLEVEAPKVCEWLDRLFCEWLDRLIERSALIANQPEDLQYQVEELKAALCALREKLGKPDD